MNVVVVDKHVEEVERSTSTVKECTRYHVHTWSYDHYPRDMVSGCVVKLVKDINQLPLFSGILDNLIPITLITESLSPDYNQVDKLFLWTMYKCTAKEVR